MEGAVRVVEVEVDGDVPTEEGGNPLEDCDLNIDEGANCAFMDGITIVFEIKEAVNNIARVIPIDEKNSFM